MKRTATERALVALLDGPRGCSEVGSMVWEHAGHPRRGRVSSVNGGGDYAAQMLLGRMRKAGLVRTTHDAGSSRWELTSEGAKRAHAIAHHDEEQVDTSLPAELLPDAIALSMRAPRIR